MPVMADQEDSPLDPATHRRVVEVLEIFFRMNREQATQVMLTVHTQGKGVCGVYTKDIAETKAAQVNQYAREHEHPLLCEIEASEG